MPQTPSKTALARFARPASNDRTREITQSEKFQPFSAKSVGSTGPDLVVNWITNITCFLFLLSNLFMICIKRFPNCRVG